MKNMIKSVLAVAATILFASVGLAETETFSFIMGAETNFTTLATSVKSAESTTGYGDFVEVRFVSGKVTFKAKTDTKDELTIVLSNDDVYKITVKTVEIEKTIMPWNNEDATKTGKLYDPNNKSNSTIRVVTHILGINVETRDPNVLFIGTLCGRHSLTNGTVATSLKAANEKANLDYYLFEKASSERGNVEPTLSGTDIAPGDPLNKIPPTFDVNETLAGERGNHYALAGMLTKLYDISQDKELSDKYDYIILEFDGSRIAEDYDSIGDEREKAVARWLKPYYEGNKVFWALDNGFDFDRDVLREDQKGSGSGKMSSSYLERVEREWGKPADKDFLDSIFAYGTRENGYWNGKRPYVVNSAFLKNSNGSNQYFLNETEDGWNGLTALLDPAIRLDERSATTTSATVYTEDGSLSTINILSGQTMENQMWYDDADKLGAAISAMIRPLPISARIADQVVQSFEGDNGVSFQDMGLNLVGATDEEKKDSIRFYQLKPEQVKGREVTADSDFWGDPLSKEYYDVVLDTMTVTGKVDKTESECWNKIEIDVVDDGTFFQKCLDAGRYEIEYDGEGNKIYILNPNNGDATVELFDESGKSLLKKDGAIVPAEQWPFEPMAMNATCEDLIAIYTGEGTNVWDYTVTNAKTGAEVADYSISNRYDNSSKWYPADKFPGYTNVVFDTDGQITSNKVWFLVVGPEGYTNTPPLSAYVTITQRLVTVQAASTNKVYREEDPTPWIWGLTEDTTDIVEGEEDDVLEALSNIVTIVRSNAEVEDVDMYSGVLTTNALFEAQTEGVLRNYRLEFIPGDFEIFKNELTYVPPTPDDHTPPQDEIDAGDATPYDYVGIYEGKGFTIRFGVTPVADLTKRPTKVRFSADNTWPADDEGWVDYKEGYDVYGDAIPRFTNCVTKAPVYVQAKNDPNYPDITNLVAYVTITQRIVRIRANSDSKVYDGEPLTNWTFEVVSGGHGFVPGEGFDNQKTTMTDASLRTDAGTCENVIGKDDKGQYTLNWKDGTLGSNYIIETEKGTLTVDKRKIDANAIGAEKVYDGTPTGIVVAVSNVMDGDADKIKKTYFDHNPDLDGLKLAMTPIKDDTTSGTEVNANECNSYKNVKGTNTKEDSYDVWCKVEVDDSKGNYIPCTVSGTVKITRRPVFFSSEKVNVTVEYGETAQFEDDPIEDKVGKFSGVDYLGMVSGETFEFYNRKTLTDPGTAKATFDVREWAIPTARMNNYTVNRAYGTLTVKKAPPTPCGPCQPCPEEEVAPTLVYKFQMNLKTTKGVTTHETVNAGSICTPAEDEDVCNVYRTKDATKLVGWIYDCTATCDTIANGSVVVWDAKRKAAFEDGAAFTPTFINVMGKKQAEAEWAWTFAGTADYPAFAATQEYTLVGAGLGKFSAKKGYYTSFSGRVAGTVTASWDLKTKKNTCCISSQIAKCDDLATLVDDPQDTVAYGTWSAKFDSTASKRYAKDGSLKLPSYMK